MKGRPQSISTEIQDFVSQFDEKSQATLWSLRDIIARSAPQASEVISYGVACFKTEYMLVGYGGGKGFCSLYLMDPALVKKHKENLKPYKASGGTIHFVPGEPLPEKLITALIKERIESNQLRWLAKNQNKARLSK